MATQVVSIRTRRSCGTLSTGCFWSAVAVRSCVWSSPSSRRMAPSGFDFAAAPGSRSFYLRPASTLRLSKADRDDVARFRNTRPHTWCRSARRGCRCVMAARFGADSAGQPPSAPARGLPGAGGLASRAGACDRWLVDRPRREVSGCSAASLYPRRSIVDAVPGQAVVESPALRSSDRSARPWRDPRRRDHVRGTRVR